MNPCGCIGLAVGRCCCLMNSKPLSLYFIYAWLALFGLIPFGLVLITSFLSTDATHLATMPLTLSHYTALFSPQFAHVFLRSLMMSILTTLCCLILAYPFSYFLVKSKHQSILLLLIIIPFWTSSLVRTYALIAILKLNGIFIALYQLCRPLWVDLHTLSLHGIANF